MASDPYRTLGVRPGDPPEVVQAAWREQAKRLHPDVAGAEDPVARRMAEVNAAYDEVRAREAARGAAPTAPGPSSPASSRPSPPRRAAEWLSDPTRRALGAELLSALEVREPVRLVVDASTWASPVARLVLTDRRLLWLLDDAVTHRVRSLRFRDVERVEQRLQWPRRRRARLRLHTRGGRRIDFSDLDPRAAAAIAGAAGSVPNAPR